MKKTLLILLTLVPAGCNSEKPSPEAGTPDNRSVGLTLPILMKVPDFLLTDQQDREYGSDQLLGRAWVANFIFTRCEATCPLQTSRLAELQEELKSSRMWTDIRLASITVDPEFDTPEVLKKYAADSGADSDNWRFLTGARTDIWNLAKNGFKLPVADDPDAKGAPITHSAKFALVDPQGHVRGFYESSSNDDIDQLKQDLNVVLQERLLFLEDVMDPSWMEKRQQEQHSTIKDFNIFHDFSFSDRRRESEISFRHRIVDDAGREHKPCHYDHGNGIAVADTDGDGLSDIYFVNQVGGNELWKNKGNGQFENVTQTAGVAVKDRIGVSASFADIDNDGDADLYVTNVRSPNVLFENDGTGRFTDISADSGLAYNGHSSSAVFFDYDRDGLLDVFLVNVGVYTTDETAAVVNDHFTGPDDESYSYKVAPLDAFSGHLKAQRSESSALFRNQGQNKFADVTKATGLSDSSWSGDASPIDVNEDGWIDLYVLNMQGHDEYYENQNGNRFVKKSRDVFPATPWGSMGVKVFDFDNDGRMDIYLTDMHTDMGPKVDYDQEKLKASPDQFAPGVMNTDGNHVWGNAFFHKQADGSYAEISENIGVETYWPWGVSTGDLNADGFEDIFVTGSMNFPFRYGVNSVLLNNRGQKFLDAEFIVGVEPRRGGRTAIPWFELDADSKDKEIVNSLRAKGLTAERFVAWGAIGSRSSAIFDVDADGDLDIVTNDFNSEPMVLISDLSSQKDDLNFVKVRLEGKKSNRDGLGAVVRVQAGKDSFTKVHDGQSGYLSQSRGPLYFGLGNHETVDRVNIAWPSGRSQTVTGPIDANSVIAVIEPETK